MLKAAGFEEKITAKSKKSKEVFIQIAQNLSRFSHSFRKIWRFRPFSLPSFTANLRFDLFGLVVNLP
jgi:hypothetical protein